MRTRLLHIHNHNHGSDESVVEIAPFTERLPFRPGPSWYDAYWCQDRRERGTDDRAPSSPSYSLLRGFVLAWLDALSGPQAAPVSHEPAEPVSRAHRPRLASGR